jgi:MATE family multidrug resistance protein
VIFVAKIMNIMRYRIEYRETARLAYPVVIGQIGHMMMGVVDSIMVGKIGAAPLAAASVANGIFLMILVFGLGISFVLSPLVAMAIGAKNVSKTKKIFQHGILINMIFSVILCLLTFLSANFIKYLNQPPEVEVLAISYMKILGFSLSPLMFFQSFKQFLEGLAVMKPAMVVTLLANIVNMFANWVFIYGNLGFPALGLNGAGIATFITRTIMAMTLSTYVIRSARFRIYLPDILFKKIDLKVIKRILRIGIPGGFQHFFEVGAFAGSAIIIGWIGTKSLAAHQIALNLASISFMIITGISAAAAVRVGHATGKNDQTATRNAGFSSIVLAMMIMGCFAIIFILLRDFLPVLYISDFEVVRIASSLLIIAALFQIFDGAQAVSIGALRGLEDAKIPMLITFISYWCIGLPAGCLFAFVFELGVLGVWIGLMLSLISSATLLVLRFHLISKKKF